MRAGRTVVVEAVDVDALVLLIPALAQAWRDLGFDDDGVYVDDGDRRREGLRVVRGRHPVTGVRYRAETDEEAVFADLVEDSRERLALLVSTEGSEHVALGAEVRHPSRPTSLHLTATGATGEQRLLGGTWSAEATIDRDQLPGGPRSDQPIVGRGVHRVVAARVAAAIRPRSDGRWDVTVEVRVTGRGCLRPLGALAGIVTGPWIRRELAASMDRLPEAVADLNRELAALAAEDPEAVATRLLHAALDAITES